MILDRLGRLVWFKPVLKAAPFDLMVQQYENQPVLTWWQGRVIEGYGLGSGRIADSSYHTVQRVHAGDGLREDLHELQVTAAGTALITAYERAKTNLSSVGGPSWGPVLISHVQEIDLATGSVLFDWNSLDHVALDESYLALPQDKTTAYDYFHVNSIAELPDGNLLISARNTWALYKLDRANGRVLWRMNGKRSDFTMGAGTHFYWQHDARMPTEGTLTLFDDGALPAEERQSRALLLAVDASSRQVSLQRAYLNPAGFLASNQGSAQLLPDGRMFVGWGSQPYFSEFAPDGALLLNGELPTPVRSYRAYTYDWVGKPTAPPRVAARSDPAGGAVVYASWNGSTEIGSWTILAGKTAADLEPVGSQEWSGFETAVAVNASGPYFSALATDAAGHVLRRTPPVLLGSGREG